MSEIRRINTTEIVVDKVDPSIKTTIDAVPVVAIIGSAPIMQMVTVVTNARTGNATEFLWRGGVRPHPRAR